MDQLLKQFEFSEPEIVVYKALLKSGGAKVSDIAKATGLKRTSTQEYIRSLEEKGFINSSKIGNKYFYQAEDPDKFRQIINERQYIADRLIPTLRHYRPDEKWQVSSLNLKDARKRIERAKRKKHTVISFGDKDVGGTIIGNEILVLFSMDNEIPSVEITSGSIVRLHKALFLER